MAPEMVVRKLLHSLGYRFRLHVKTLPGKPDIVFTRRKKAIFVHGCFWHQHEDKNCKISRLPKSRQEYWIPKLQRNTERDKKHILLLENEGWQILVLWECELRQTEDLAHRLNHFLGPTRFI